MNGNLSSNYYPQSECQINLREEILADQPTTKFDVIWREFILTES